MWEEYKLSLYNLLITLEESNELNKEEFVDVADTIATLSTYINIVKTRKDNGKEQKVRTQK